MVFLLTDVLRLPESSSEKKSVNPVLLGQAGVRDLRDVLQQRQPPHLPHEQGAHPGRDALCLPGRI